MTFSDPDRDFDSEYLALMSKKMVSDYSSYDWMNIFQCVCALGTFGETVHLVDDALKFVQRRSEGYIDVFDHLLSWLECYDEKLSSLNMADRYMDIVIAVVSGYFDNYTILEKKHACYPLGGDVIWSAVKAAQSFSRIGTSLRMLDVLKSIPASFVHAAWLIELECFVREGWVSGGVLFCSEEYRSVAVSQAYDIVVNEIMHDERRIECRRLASLIEQNYIGA